MTNMDKRVILITGTPCTGKTSVSKQLAARLDALHINLTEIAKTHNLTIGEDKKRNTAIIDERKMRAATMNTIDETEKTTVIVDGHYAAAIVSKRYVTYAFVLRRNPIELRKFMEKRGFSNAKLWENLASEILDVCLVDALQQYDKERVCELDITGKTLEAVVSEIIEILENRKKCQVGCVDWLDILEKKGLASEYLKV